MDREPDPSNARRTAPPIRWVREKRADRDPVLEHARELHRDPGVFGEVAPGAQGRQHVIPSGVPVEGRVTRGHAIVAQAEVLTKIALLHRIHIHAKSGAAAKGPVKT